MENVRATVQVADLREAVPHVLTLGLADAQDRGERGGVLRLQDLDGRRGPEPDQAAGDQPEKPCGETCLARRGGGPGTGQLERRKVEP